LDDGFQTKNKVKKFLFWFVCLPPRKLILEIFGMEEERFRGLVSGEAQKKVAFLDFFFLSSFIMFGPFDRKREKRTFS
jgi:hypothetical protein